MTGTGPQMPVPRATPEKLVALLVTIANRLERLEGIADRLAEQQERTVRRFDAHEVRIVAMNEKLHMTALFLSRVGDRAFTVWAMASTAAATLLVAGITAAVVRHLQISGWLS
jgi:hypothetical protein